MKYIRKMAMFCVLFIALGALVYGSGFAIYEHGARGMAQAGAFVARASDPSALWFNPAGITQLPGTQIYGGGTAILHSSTFFSEGAALTIESDDEVGLPPNLYITHQLTDKVWVGVSLNAPFGLSKTWPPPSSTDPLVYHTKYASLQMLFISGAVALKVSDDFSIGAGGSWVHGSILWERYGSIDALVTAMSLGAITNVDDLYFKADVTGDAFSFFGGIQWKINPSITFGASYHSGAEMELTGDVLFEVPTTPIPIVNTTLAYLFADQTGTAIMPFADNIMGGFAFKVSESLDIEADVYYTLWSKYNELSLDFTVETNLTTLAGVIPIVEDTLIEKNWDDTFCFRLGGEYHVSPALDIRFGVLYDQNPIPDETLDPMLPDNDRFALSAGIGYKSGGFVVDFAYMILLLGERKAANNDILLPLGIPDQNYEATQAHLFGLNIGITL